MFWQLIFKGRYFFCGLLFLGLTGCGFHLRGQNMLPPALQQLYLESYNVPRSVSGKIQDYLQQAGVIFVESPARGTFTLELLNAQFEKALTSISGNTQVRSYLLTYSINFQLKNRLGQIIYGPVLLQTTASSYTSDNQLLGDTEAMERQRHNMERYLINQILVRLNSAEVRSSLR